MQIALEPFYSSFAFLHPPTLVSSSSEVLHWEQIGFSKAWFQIEIPRYREMTPLCVGGANIEKLEHGLIILFEAHT